MEQFLRNIAGVHLLEQGLEGLHKAMAAPFSSTSNWIGRKTVAAPHITHFHDFLGISHSRLLFSFFGGQKQRLKMSED